MSSSIGIISNSLDQKDLTGPAVYLYYMLDHLLELPGVRQQVSLVHYREYKRPLYQRAQETIVPRSPLLSELALRQEGFDILHYNSLPTLRPFYLLPGKKVLTLHGLAPLILPHLSPRYPHFERAYLWPLLAKGFDKIIAVSEFTRQSAIKHWRIPPEKICAIHSGVSTQFKPQPEQKIIALKERIGSPYLLHISNFNTKKNSVLLINTFAKLKQKKQPHKLVIIGGRWESSPIPALIAELQLDDDVIFVGYETNENLPVWYSAADAFVTLSLHESFCFPIVEAMACGCPVVALNRTAFPEIIGDAGLLIDEPLSAEAIANHLAWLLEDRELIKHLREKGLKRAAKFSWQENARQTWQLYQSLL
ncbi:MAG: glycosyltransferase family 1 protein [Chloroflexota bacterium]